MSIRVTTSFNIEIEFPPAPFHRRLLAWFIDTIVGGLYILMITMIFAQSGWGGVSSKEEALGLYLVITFVPYFCYHLICELLLKGQSIGKRITQLQVVNLMGGRVSVSQVIIRWLIRTSDLMVVVIVLVTSSGAAGRSFLEQFGISFLMLVADILLVNLTPRNQRLGDLLAGTMVIRNRQEGAITDTIFRQVHESYEPRYPQVMRLSDRDINSLKSILVSARRNNDYDLAERAAFKVRTHLNINDNSDAYQFIDTLLTDYNYLSAH